MNKDQQVRVLIYSALAVLLAVGGFLFYLVWQDNQNIPVDVAESTTVNQVDQKTIDSSVLETAKFKELAPVQVIDVSTTTTASPDSGRLNASQLSRIPRRNSNPFLAY